MVREPLRVRVRSIEDLRTLLDGIREDHTPRLIEEADGELIAVLMDPTDYAEVTHIPKNRLNKERILSFIGSWSDLEADRMISDIHRWREEAPASTATRHPFA